jgi:hypothetical protein
VRTAAINVRQLCVSCTITVVCSMVDESHTSFNMRCVIFILPREKICYSLHGVRVSHNFSCAVLAHGKLKCETFECESMSSGVIRLKGAAWIAEAVMFF